MMNNLIALLKIRLFHSINLEALKQHASKQEKQKLILSLFLLLTIILLISGYSYFYLDQLAPIFNQLGQIHTLVGTMMAIASFTILWTSIYKINGTLIHSHEDDILYALPLSSSMILFSKWFPLYLFNLLLCLLFMLPMFLVVSEYMSLSPILYLFTIPFIPLLPMVTGGFLGMLADYLSRFFKHKHIIQILLIFILVTLVLYYSFNLNTPQDLIDFGKVLSDLVIHIYPLSFLYIQGICQGHILSWFVFILINFIPFYLSHQWLKHHHSDFNQPTTTSTYKITSMKQNTITFTLFKKEFKRYIASPVYVTNTAIGILLQTLGVIYICVKGLDSFQNLLQIPGIETMFTTLIPYMLCVCIGIGTTTAASISLEGRQLWIMKTIPVTSMMIFKAKMGVQILVTLPLSLINILILSFMFHLSFSTILFTTIIVLLYILFSAQIGLIINLHFPKLDYENEVTVVKQSMATFLTLVITLVSSMLPIYLATL